MENGNGVSVALELSERDGDPYWTKTGSWTMGLDPLGLQATSIRIYQSLVPNITNITNRLRYYAYFPWLIELYEKKHHSNDPARFARFIQLGLSLCERDWIADTFPRAASGRRRSDRRSTREQLQ